MSQVLQRERQDSGIAERRTGTAGRRLVVALVVALALSVGMTGGWLAFTAVSGPDVADIQQRRAEGMVEYHERLWGSRARPQEIERVRHEAMADYYERLWREGGEGR
jgi:hypothetical protein